MRVLVLSVVFVVTFAVTVLANLPLAPFVTMANLAAYGVDHGAVRGTIWHGAIEEISASGRDIGRVEAQIHAASLLTGRLEADVRVDGPGLRGAGRLSLAVSGRAAMRNASLTLDVQAVESLHELVRARGGEVFVRVDSLVFDRRGCRAAAGLISTDVLARPDGRTSWRGPDLEGGAQCRDGVLVLMLNGENADAAVQIEARLTPEGEGGLRANVQTQDPNFDLAAGLFGFDRSNGAYTYERTVTFLELDQS